MYGCIIIIIIIISSSSSSSIVQSVVFFKVDGDPEGPVQWGKRFGIIPSLPYYRLQIHVQNYIRLLLYRLPFEHKAYTIDTTK